MCRIYMCCLRRMRVVNTQMNIEYRNFEHWNVTPNSKYLESEFRINWKLNSFYLQNGIYSAQQTKIGKNKWTKLVAPGAEHKYLMVTSLSHIVYCRYKCHNTQWRSVIHQCHKLSLVLLLCLRSMHSYCTLALGHPTKNFCAKFRFDISSISCTSIFADQIL